MTKKDYFNAVMFVLVAALVIGLSSYGVFYAANSYHIGKIEDRAKEDLELINSEMQKMCLDITTLQEQSAYIDSSIIEHQRMINFLDTLGGKLINFANQQVKWNNDNTKR